MCVLCVCCVVLCVCVCVCVYACGVCVHVRGCVVCECVCVCVRVRVHVMCAYLMDVSSIIGKSSRHGFTEDDYVALLAKNPETLFQDESYMKHLRRNATKYISDHVCMCDHIYYVNYYPQDIVED